MADVDVVVAVHYVVEAHVDAAEDAEFVVVDVAAAAAVVAENVEEGVRNTPADGTATFEPRPCRRRDDRGRAIAGGNWLPGPYYH